MNAPLPSLPGRFRLISSQGTAARNGQWFALDGETGRYVIVVRARSEQAERYQAVKGEKHLNLAGVLEVVEESQPGSSLVVAEFVPGRTLSGLLSRGPVHPFKAVAWLLRLVDAVAALHAKGGVHGAISPRSIVVEPVGRAVAPVLAQLVCPAIGPYCSPERLGGTGPGALDDLWALHATLYVSLTGAAPFSGTRHGLVEQMRSGKARPLAEYGLQEPVLANVLERGLAADEQDRITDIAELSHALDAWESGRKPESRPRKVPAADHRPAAQVQGDVIVIDEAVLPAQESLEIPEEDTVRTEVEPMPWAERASAPLAPAEAPAQAASIAEPTPPARKISLVPRGAPPPLPTPVARTQTSAARPGRWPLFGGIGALAVCLSMGGFYWALSKPRPEPASAETMAGGSAAAQSSQARGASSAGLPTHPGEQLRACVVSYFDPADFEGAPDFGFLCQDDDLRKIAASLFPPAVSRETADAGGSAPSKGPGGLVVRGSTREELGWYELVATTVVRSACCKDAALPVLPKTEGWCQQLQGEVRKIADATRKSGDLGPYARRFEDAVVCLYATGTTRPYRYEKAPEESHRRALQMFLKHAAESDGVRARMPWLR